MKKRLLSVIAALAMVVAVIAPATGAYASLGIANEREVSIMAALGIVPGYPLDYKADSAVTQKDFIQYAYRAADVELTNPGDYAEQYGWGDGSTQITVSQAAQVLFEAIDYKRMVDASNSDAYTFASTKGVLSGIKSSGADSGLTKEAAAVMIYNTLQLDTPRYENDEYSYGDETVMEDKLNVFRKRGIVTGTYETALTGYGTVSKDSVRIDTLSYKIGTTTANELLGMSVEFYYKEDDATDEDVIKWIETENVSKETVVVYGCDVTDIDGKKVTYDSSSGSKKTVTIDANADIIYNGKLANDVSIDAVSSLTSETTFIKNGSSSNCSVVIIDDYTYYKVDSYTSSTYTVNDYSAKTSIVLDENKLDSLRIYSEGVLTDVNSIAVNQVLAVVRSKDEKVVKVEILTSSVEGEITAYSTHDVTIGANTYDISPAYEGDRIMTGRSGTFYFDKLGKIVRCTAMKSQTSQYAYLLKFYSESGGGGDYYARLLTAQGTIEEFKVKDSLSFNSHTASSQTAADSMWDGETFEQLITYSVNSANEITSIKTADKKYIGVDEANIDSFTLNYTGSGRYRKNNMTFNSKYLVDGTTPIFFVPYNGERNEYTVKDVSYLTNNYTYDISIYDIDDYMYAGAVVLKENLIEPENLRTKRSLAVTRVYQSIDEDNDIKTMIEGYQQGSKVSYPVDNDNLYDNRGTTLIKDLKQGDIVQVGVNTKGNINAVQILFRARSNRLVIADGTSTPNEYWEGGTSVFPDLWVSVGTVTDRNSDVILVDSDGDDTKVTKKPHKLGSAVTYVFENDELSASNKNEIAVGDSVYVHEYQGNVQEVVIVR